MKLYKQIYSSKMVSQKNYEPSNIAGQKSNILEKDEKVQKILW